MVKRLVRFLSTVAIGTPRALRAKKLVKIMPTKIRFTGNHSFTIGRFIDSTLINPAHHQVVSKLSVRGDAFKDQRC